MLTPAEGFVQFALGLGAFGLGRDWDLKSERISPYMFDMSRFCSGKGINVLINHYASLLYANKLISTGSILFGLPSKGTFLVSAIALHFYTNFKRKVNVSFASCRKETKLHGEHGRITGLSIKNRDVIIVDDVLTTALTAQEYMTLVLEEGGRVAAYVVAFDRQEYVSREDKRSAARVIKEGFDVPVFSIAKLSDLISVLRDSPANSHVLQKILNYQSWYGAQ